MSGNISVGSRDYSFTPTIEDSDNISTIDEAGLIQDPERVNIGYNNPYDEEKAKKTTTLASTSSGNSETKEPLQVTNKKDDVVINNKNSNLGGKNMVDKNNTLVIAPTTADKFKLLKESNKDHEKDLLTPIKDDGSMQISDSDSLIVESEFNSMPLDEKLANSRVLGDSGSQVDLLAGNISLLEPSISSVIKGFAIATGLVDAPIVSLVSELAEILTPFIVTSKSSIDMPLVINDNYKVTYILTPHMVATEVDKRIDSIIKQGKRDEQIPVTVQGQEDKTKQNTPISNDPTWFEWWMVPLFAIGAVSSSVAAWKLMKAVVVSTVSKRRGHQAAKAVIAKIYADAFADKPLAKAANLKTNVAESVSKNLARTEANLDDSNEVKREHTNAIKPITFEEMREYVDKQKAANQKVKIFIDKTWNYNGIMVVRTGPNQTPAFVAKPQELIKVIEVNPIALIDSVVSQTAANGVKKVTVSKGARPAVKNFYATKVARSGMVGFRRSVMLVNSDGKVTGIKYQNTHLPSNLPVPVINKLPITIDSARWRKPSVSRRR